MVSSESREDVRSRHTDDVGEEVPLIDDVAVVEVYDVSLQEATRLYDVSLATLRKRVRWGEIFAYKTRGPWGDEWRVSGPALEAYGYRRRSAADHEPSLEERFAAMEREIATLRRLVTLHRERADRADRERGEAMLECGRLRTALDAGRGVGDPEK